MKKRKPHHKVLGMYFTEDEKLREDYRDLMLERYLAETNDDLWEALGILRWRLEQAELEESYEECAIIKDILKEFGYVSEE